MKSKIFLAIMVMLLTHVTAQTTQNGSTKASPDTIEWIKSLDEHIPSTYKPNFKGFRTRFIDEFMDEPRDTVYKTAKEIAQILMANEKKNQISDTIHPETQAYILAIKNSLTLMLVSEEIERSVNTSNVHYLERLSTKIQSRLYTLNYYQNGHYVYKNNKKTLVKFVHVQSGNDLFRLPGLFNSLPNVSPIFQRNDDMDYTGSLRIDVGTDYLNTYRKRGLKTYQVLFYGFDVYTPYFKDLNIFSKSDTFNINDRPHGSFQYFGWGKRGISQYNKYRWAIDFKLGIIGSDIGYRFQKTLHQDISDSPIPRGWGAQVANGGRLGWSLEVQPEWQFPFNKTTRLKFQTGLDLKFGSHITHGGIMLRLSNKDFASMTHHNISAYKRNTKNNFHYAAQITGFYVQHNSMLQGYGIYRPLETSNDTLFRISRHRLTSDQVRNFTAIGQITIGYTFYGATVYYQYRIYSPETNLGITGSYRPGSNHQSDLIDLTNRWHRFGIIGITFNILQHKAPRH
jgi:hypothetical protein